MKSQRQLRQDAARIWSAALRSVDPQVAVRAFVSRQGRRLKTAGVTYDLDELEHVWIIGVGKAAATMALGVQRILGAAVSGGMLVTKYGHGLPQKRLELIEAGHPLPDRNGIRAGSRIAEFVRTHVGPRDLVICLLSGGGSALVVSPAQGISLEDKLSTTQALLTAGATIHEMNAIRKHLSDLKGGGLARLLGSTQVLSLILSDVVGDDLTTIASGPLVADPTTFGQCLEIIERLNIADRIPAPVLRRLEEGVAGRVPETPKPGDPIFQSTRNVVIGSNAQACTASARQAVRLGYHTTVLTSRLEGDTAEAARFHMSVAQEIVSCDRPVRKPACVISGGETTVQVRGSGRGGRNQEFTLHSVRPLATIGAPCVSANLGTDGTDGPTDAAGAVADNTTLARSMKFGAGFLEECLRSNNSYEFFKRTGDLITTGPTRTNVMDLHILLIG